MIEESPLPGAPDIIIADKNPAHELLYRCAYDMTNLAYLARPRERWDIWDRGDYHRIAELPNPTLELDTLSRVTQVIKLMAEAPELLLLEHAHAAENIISFKKIREERRKNSEVHSLEPKIPFSSFELLLYKRIASGIDFLHWKYEKEITQNLRDAMDANPSITWQAMQLFGIDMLLPGISHLQRKERATIAKTIKKEMYRLDNTKSGSDIFCDAVGQTPLGDRFRHIVQFLPQLYAYYDESRAENEPQEDEYPMHIALALAYYSEIRGTGPFGAVIVDPDGFLLGATNEIDPETKKRVHAETMLMKKAYAWWGPEIKGLTIYSTAAPCFRCAGEILDGAPVKRIVYGVNTMMDMVYFGISDAKHLTKLECGDPEITPGVLEKQIREFYKSVGYIDLIRPET